MKEVPTYAGVDFQAEVEVFRPDGYLVVDLLEDNVEGVTLEQAVLSGRDDLAAEIFFEKRSLALVSGVFYTFSIDTGGFHMAYNRRHARGLLSASELPLFECSVGEALTGWSAAQLRQKIKRACTLRDKYRDLLRRQKLATRERTGTKSGVLGNDNARTEQKVKLFEEVQQRLEGRQAKLAATEARQANQAERALALAVIRKPLVGKSKVVASKGPSSKREAVAAATISPKARVGLTSEKASAAAQRSQLAGSRSKVIQTHLAAQGRRQQAVRDKR